MNFVYDRASDSDGAASVDDAAERGVCVCRHGDIGRRSFRAIAKTLESPRTTYTRPSNFFSYYSIYIVRMEVAGNRLPRVP